MKLCGGSLRGKRVLDIGCLVLFPTLTSLYDMLETAGFVNARLVEASNAMPENYTEGRRVTVIAEVPDPRNHLHFQHADSKVNIRVP